MLNALKFVWENFLCNDGFVIFLLIFLGQLAAKKTRSEAFAGGLKGYIGFLVYCVATGGMGTAYRPFLEAFTNKYAANIAINDSYYGLSIMQSRFTELGGNLGLSSIVMLVGLGFGILLVLCKRITKIRCLSIQGSSYAYEGWRCLLLVFCIYPFVPTWQVIVMAGAYLAIHACVSGNLSITAAQDLTDGCNMAIDHCQNIGSTIAWHVGKRIEKRSIEKTGKPPKSFDNLKLPGWLSIFNDVYVSCFLVMFLFFGAIILALGRESIAAIDSSFTEGSSFLAYTFTTAGKFPMYLVILFTGLRMFVAEIMVAFEGLNKRILKGVLPSVDIAAFFGFVENGNVITMGFLIGTIVMLLCTTIGILIKSPFVVMMGFTQMMFDNAPVAMFGHKHGGIKGLVFGAALSGIVDTVLGGLALYLLGYTPYTGAAFQFDYAIEFSLFGWVLPRGAVFFVIFLVCLLAVPQIQYALCKDKQDYWLIVEDYEAYKAKHANDQ